MEMGESRFQRLEDKVDTLKQDVTEIKVNMKTHITKIEEHIAGDKKIISEWLPVVKLVPQLQEVIQNHNFQKELNKKRIALVKNISALLGILFGIIKLIEYI